MKPPYCRCASTILVMLIAAGLFACSNSPDEAVPTVAPTAPQIAALPIPTNTLPAVTTRLLPTPLPSATPRPTPCQLPLQPTLRPAWEEAELGCPTTPGATAITTAYAPFEGGQMLWRGDSDTIYVLYNDGTWQSYPNAWREGDPEYTCGETSSPPTPVRGFGRVWCAHADVRAALGAVTAAEIGDSGSAAQDFVNGTILAAPFGDLFVFEGEDGAWRLVEGRR